MSRNRRVVSLFSLFSVVGLLFSCTPPPAAPAAAPAAQEAAAPASDLADGHYAWDHAAKKWSPEAPNPSGMDVALDDNWQPNPRKSAKKFVIGFANLSSDIDFSVNVLNGIQKAADEAGLELFVTDNKFPDNQLPLTNADANVTRQVDLVLNFNVLGDLGGAIMEKYSAAGIPSISIDVKHPTSLFFGADNCMAGKVGGEWMVEYAKKNNWPADKIITVGAEDPAVGEAPNFRISCFEDAVKAAFPDAQSFRIPDGTQTEKTLEHMSAWLTSHPDDHHIMTISINDQGSTGILAAVQAAGREADVAIMGVGGDQPAKAELAKEDNAFKGSVGYFPEKYGEYLIPMALDVLEGVPVPAEVHLQHVVVDRENFREYYPDFK